MAIRPITLYGETVLARPTADVERMDEALRSLIADMWETMYHARGVGLAANQIGVGLRLAVIDVSPVVEGVPKIVLINPRIVETAGERSEEEGCLSVPGLSNLVVRPTKVRCEALDENLQPVVHEAEGFLAKAFCHEVDHLDGKVYLDRLSRLKRELMQKQIRRLKSDGAWDDPYPAGGPVFDDEDEEDGDE